MPRERRSEQRVCACGNTFRATFSAIARGGGKHCSSECYRVASLQIRGERKGNWRGDDVGYAALHDWVRREKGPPLRCQTCGSSAGRLEWANISHEYRRDASDWMALCARCHRRYDQPATCQRGHERTEQNTWVDKDGHPHCRVCRNERLRLQRRGLSLGAVSRRSTIREKFNAR